MGAPATLEREVIFNAGRDLLSDDLFAREDALRKIDELTEDLERLRQELEGSRRFAMLVGSDGTELRVPVPVYEILIWVVQRMAEGKAFTLAPIDKELTTQEAADLLNVSRPFLIKLLDQDQMPYRRTGTHRRVKLTDVLAYREEQFARTGEIIREMGREEREWDLEDPQGLETGAG